MILIQITAPHFCAAIESEGGRVIQVAPILRYMHGWETIKMIRYVDRKRWKKQVIEVV